MQETKKQEIGNKGENIACEYLQKNGYRIIERNYRVPGGEIDIIARHKDELIFFEVKTRISVRYGYPEEAVHTQKMRKIVRAIKSYLLKTRIIDTYIRFDILAIELGNEAQHPLIQHIKNVELKENVM